MAPSRIGKTALEREAMRARIGAELKVEPGTLIDGCGRSAASIPATEPKVTVYNQTNAAISNLRF